MTTFVGKHRFVEAKAAFRAEAKAAFRAEAKAGFRGEAKAGSSTPLMTHKQKRFVGAAAINSFAKSILILCGGLSKEGHLNA